MGFGKNEEEEKVDGKCEKKVVIKHWHCEKLA